MALAADDAGSSRLCVFDTAIATDNLGDHIIMDAVWDVLRPLFSDASFLRTPSHRRASLSEIWTGHKAALSIVGGTNILIRSDPRLRGCHNFTRTRL